MASDDSSECKALFQAKNMLATTKMREVGIFFQIIDITKYWHFFL